MVFLDHTKYELSKDLSLLRSKTDQIGEYQDFPWDKLEKAIRALEDINIALDLSNIVAITDAKGKITFVNDQFCKISKYSREELLGEDHRIINSGYHSDQFFRDMWSTIQRGQVWQGKIKNKAKDGTYYWVKTTIVPFLDRVGKPYQYVSLRTDITKLKEAQDTIHHMAYHDPLTDLPNRRMFHEQLSLKLEKAKENNGKFALLFLDVDRFKHLNDNFGHTLGDFILQQVAQRLRTHWFIQDNLYRLGGDEFIILFPDLKNYEEIETVVQDLQGLFHNSFMINGHEFFITLSIGVSIYPDHGEDRETLVTNADTAMYWAKGRGGNTYRIYQLMMNEGHAKLLHMETKLRKAIELEQFQLYYQPQINLTNREVTGMEALIRWHDPELGMVPPDQFIPLAEERGLIYDIDEWTIRTACKQNKQWQLMGYPFLRVAVNISPKHLQQPHFVQMIMRILEETGLEARYLELEITERSMMHHSDQLIITLTQLKKMGIAISIDDFGTGFSSLNYLTRYPIDALKIDRSFVGEIPVQSDAEMIVTTIIHLAHNLNLKVIAEGVESDEQLGFLFNRNCDEAQGYIFSKPLPRKQFEEFLSKRDLAKERSCVLI